MVWCWDVLVVPGVAPIVGTVGWIGRLLSHHVVLNIRPFVYHY